MDTPVKILDANGNPMRADAGPGSLKITGRDTNTLGDWNPASRSADASILPSKMRDTARARDLVEGNGFAATGVRRNKVSIIGTGLRLDYTPNAKALGLDPEDPALRDFIDTVESEFELYAGDINTGADVTARTHLGGLANQSFFHYFVDGDSFTNVLWSKNKYRRYQTCLQNIDPDRVSNPFGKTMAPSKGGQIIKGGIELNSYGAPIAYHVREQHPSEVWLGGKPKVDWKRIPAFVNGMMRRNLIHYYAIERAGQTRGKSMLHCVLEPFKKLDLFKDVSIKAALINAMLSFVVESPFDDALVQEQLGNTDASAAELTEYQKIRNEFHSTGKLAWGDVSPKFLAPGEKFIAIDANRPSPEYAQFVSTFMEELAAANGMSLEQYTGNWTKTNYASARAALNEAWKIIKVERDNFARHWYTHVFELWLEEALDKGYVQLPASANANFYENRQAWINCSWIGPGRGYVDPVKEIEAAARRIELGLSTLKKEAAEQGDDFRKLLEQLLRERKLMQAQGIDHPMDVARQKSMHPSTVSVPDAGASGANQDDTDQSSDDDELEEDDA